MFNWTGVAFDLSADHKAGRPDEIIRIVESGGFVVNGRVNGSLGVSRALGDIEYKRDGRRLVSNEPEIFTDMLTGGQDEFIILACDGLWDVMTSQQACEFVQTKIEEKNFESVAESLASHAINDLRSSDNVSVVVVRMICETLASRSSMRSNSSSDVYARRKSFTNGRSESGDLENLDSTGGFGSTRHAGSAQLIRPESSHAPGGSMMNYLLEQEEKAYVPTPSASSKKATTSIHNTSAKPTLSSHTHSTQHNGLRAYAGASNQISRTPANQARPSGLPLYSRHADNHKSIQPSSLEASRTTYVARAGYSVAQSSTRKTSGRALSEINISKSHTPVSKQEISKSTHTNFSTELDDDDELMRFLLDSKNFDDLKI